LRQYCRDNPNAGDISTRPVEVGDKAESDWVSASDKDDPAHQRIGSSVAAVFAAIRYIGLASGLPMTFIKASVIANFPVFQTRQDLSVIN
jgi:hypothetical protein